MRLLIAMALALMLAACGDPVTQAPETPLAKLRGQWVVVNYWAEWCKPCVKEIPELNALDADHDNITVVGVNYDGLTGDALAAQEQALGVAFPTIADPAGELATPRPVVLPTSLVLDPRGRLTVTLVGPQTAASLLTAIGPEQAAP